MKLWRLALAGALALCAAVLVPSLNGEVSTARAGTGKRVALVVGNSNYTHVGRLPSPVKDAAQWVQALKGAGFDVDQCLDCKLSLMKDKLNTFQTRIASGDEAVFYYSGHGAEQNDINLLFPVDADVQGCGTLFEQSVSLTYVLDSMDSARVKVVVLDACRSSPFPSCTKSTEQRLYGPPQVAPDGTLIAYGTTRGDLAQDDGQGSAYSRALLPLAFQPGKPLYQALSEAVPKVREATGGRQVPWVYSSLSGAPYAFVPGISLAGIADARWPKIAALPDGPEKSSEVVNFLSDYGTSGAASVRAAQAYLTGQTGTKATVPPLGKVGNPPAGGPNGRTYVAMKGTSGEMTFIALSEGVFDMGSRNGLKASDEHPHHRVRIAAFAIGQSEVTQAQWAAVVQAAQTEKDMDAAKLVVGPSYFKGAQRPVEHMSWCDAARFANALSRLEHRKPAYTVGTACEQGGTVGWDHTADGYRLPTEAEWEYAARAGTSTAYFFGDDPTQLCGYANVADQAGKRKYTSWAITECDDGYAETAPVCSFAQNAWGLCDVTGNVWEWTWDVYDSTWYGHSSSANPEGPADRGDFRVSRGGSWDVTPAFARSAFRSRFSPSLAFWDVGFRLVAPVPASAH